MSKRLTTEEFILRSSKIHKSFYNYSKSNYVDNYTKLIIVCPKHGEFLQSPSNHLRKSGCIKCRNEYFSNLNTSAPKHFIECANKIHKYRYNYSKINYVNGQQKVDIICPKHGIFLQTPSVHLAGHGCQICGRNKKSTQDSLNPKEFIEKSLVVHGNRYDYSLTNYTLAVNKVEIICPLHGKFSQLAQHHLQGHGCPKCNWSKGELKIMNFLDKNKMRYISQKTFGDCKNPKTNTKLRFDFYIQSKNILIEFDGEQHFRSGIKLCGGHCGTIKDLKYTQYKDKIKTDYAKDNCIQLVRIKYTDLSRIDEILSSLLLGT